MSKGKDHDDESNSSHERRTEKFWQNLDKELRGEANTANYYDQQSELLPELSSTEKSDEAEHEKVPWQGPELAPELTPNLTPVQGDLNQSDVPPARFEIAAFENNPEFQKLLSHAQLSRRHEPISPKTIASYERVLAYAQEWLTDKEISVAIQELSDLYMDAGKFPQALKSLKVLFRKQETALGKSHPELALTEVRIGQCLARMHHTYEATKTLRSAVVRYQQSDSVDVDSYIDCLCVLSSVYRADNNTTTARSSIKQGYKVLSATDASLRTQCKLLEELAAVLLCERRYAAAAAAYTRVVEMKKELLRTEFADIVRPLIDLGLCNFSMHNHAAAEQSLLAAGEMYHQLRYRDSQLLARLLETFSGIMRNQGQFIQADLLDEAAGEIRGRADQTGGHALYGESIKNARRAEAQGDWDSAEESYREALCALESQFHRRSPHRLLILAKLYLRAKPNSMQRIGLLSEIEDSISELFCGAVVHTKIGLERIALIFRLSAKPQDAADLLELAAVLPEDSIAICNFDSLLAPSSKQLRKDDEEDDIFVEEIRCDVNEPQIKSINGIPFKDGLPFFE